MYSLAVIVLHDLTKLDDMMNAWRRAGAPAVTILSSVETRELQDQSRRGDLPLMPTMKDLLQADDAPRKMMFAVVEDGTVDALIEATEDLLGDLSEPHKGILITFPLSRVVGYRGP